MTDTTSFTPYTQRPPVRRPPRSDPRLMAGIGFVVLFLVGLAITFGLANASWPTPATSPADVLAFFTTNHAAAGINALSQGLAAVALLVFTAGLARTFGGRAAPQLIAAGSVAGSTLLLSALMVTGMSTPLLAGQPAMAGVLYYFGYLIGGPAHVVALGMLLATTAVAGKLSGRLPGWLSTFGFVVAGLGLLAVLNFAVPLAPSFVAVFIPAGRFLGFVFIVLAALTLRRRTPAHPAA